MTLGGSMRSQITDYEASWSSLQKCDRLIWGIAVSFVPCMAVLMIGAMMAGRQVVPQAFVWAAALWLIAYVGASRYRMEFRCPRCARHFFARGREQHHCAACGLPLWSHGSEGGLDADNTRAPAL